VRIGWRLPEIRQVLRAANPKAAPVVMARPRARPIDGNAAMDRLLVPPDPLLDEDELDALEAGLASELERAMRPLSERERVVLRLRFGLGSDRQLTLDEIGRRFSVTRERIRQIEASALAKIRDARGRAA
jgi:RNA polymerase primary sigma factor